MNNRTDWIQSLRPAILGFLSALKHRKPSGFYSYSLSGDIYDPSVRKWGLGNTVFAAKTYYMLNALDRADAADMASFIKSFQSESGEISDPIVEKKSAFRRVLSSLKSFDFNNIANQQTRTAETRQAYAALRCLGFRPDRPFHQIAYSTHTIASYIHSLNWQSPWNAASHFSHLIFFLKNNSELFHENPDEIEALLEFAFQEVGQFRQRDGSWYRSGTSLPDFQKVNGAMKMMVAYNAAERDDFENPEGLIDLCLSSVNDGDACNNFNIICVLYNCMKKSDHKKNEIIKFCSSRLEIYRKYWWPDYGGFSFLPGRANKIYYGAEISKGLAEPDIHGTHLYLWGVVLISDILGLNSELNFRPPIT